MCGRVKQTGPELPGIYSEMGSTEEEVAQAWKAIYNGSPTQWLWIVSRIPGSGRNEHCLMRWGLIPNWAKDPSTMPLMFNARCEGIQSKPAFRDAYKSRRCLVPVDNFFEWRKTLGEGGKPVKGPKQPYALAMKDRSKFALAGLWESWTDPATAQITRSFTIVTCEPNSLVATIHDRMPVILAPENYERWMANIEPDPFDLMAPFPPELMDMWPISSKVSSAGYNQPDVTEPVQDDQLI
jgi:putative SOS response-associated peptidase YedK